MGASTAVRIRSASAADVLRVYAMHRRCFKLHYAFWRFPAYWLGSQSGILVAYLDGRLAGYLMYSVGPHGLPRVPTGEVISLAVDQPFRRRRVAWGLLGAVAGRFSDRGLSAMVLQVAVSNQAAQQLYEQYGFRRVSRLPRYYKDGEDGYLLQASLEGDRQVEA